MFAGVRVEAWMEKADFPSGESVPASVLAGFCINLSYLSQYREVGSPIIRADPIE